MRNLRIVGAIGALVLAAVVGGTAIGSALATDEQAGGDTSGGATGARAEYCQTFVTRLAQELGVDEARLLEAGKTAARAAVDAAVAGGDLTEEQATALRERIDAADSIPCPAVGLGRGGFGHHRHGLGVPAIGLLGELADAAAGAVGLERAELMERLTSGQSLQEIAGAEGVDYAAVRTAIHDAAQARLNEAVEAGRLTREQADAGIARLDAWLEAGGELPFGVDVDGRGLMERFRLVPRGDGDGRPPFGQPDSA